MDRTLVLHVGLPKCGSTSLQDAMAESAALLAESNIHFIRLRPIKLINTLAAGQRQETWSKLLGEEPPSLVVVSSEYLCTLTPGGIDGLLAPIAGLFTRIHVVFVLRTLDDWVLSRLNQRAQGLPGGHIDPDADGGLDADSPFLRVGLDVGDPDEWLATWSEWADADDSRDLTVIPLVAGEPLPQRFLDAIDRPDVELPAAAAQTWSNRSVDDHALELIARMHDLAELLRVRQELASIREDNDAFTLIKQVISLAKKWDRPPGVKPSPQSLRSAAKIANGIRDRLAIRLQEPLLTEVAAIIGTRESSKRERKLKTRAVTEGALGDTATSMSQSPSA